MPFSQSGGGTATLSGVTVSGTAAAGNVPVASSSSAAAWAFPPGFEIGYDQITSPVNVASTTEATGTTVITCGAHTFDGGLVLATFWCPFLTQGSNAGVSVTVSLFEGATQITRLAVQSTAGTAIQAANPGTGMFRFTPTAASHTYTVTAFASSTTGTPQVGAGAGGTAAYAPAFIRFTKV